jgi:hypothetical protein
MKRVIMQMDWEAADINVLRFIAELFMRYGIAHTLSNCLNYS